MKREVRLWEGVTGQLCQELCLQDEIDVIEESVSGDSGYTNTVRYWLQVSRELFVLMST